MTEKCKNCNKLILNLREDRLNHKYCNDCFNDLGLKLLIEWEKKHGVFKENEL